MKRLLFQSIFVLCLIAAFSLASCNRMEENPDNAQEIQQPAGIAFTATLAPKGENPQTKAISSGTDDNGKEILNVAWAVDEKIALYYQISGGYAKATAKVTKVNDGVATISASLDEATLDGGTVQFVYPASLANDKGDDIDESKLLSQNGNLTGENGISTKFDAATGEGTIKLSGGTSLPTTATVTNKTGTGSVSLQNRVCICKFRFDLDDGTSSSMPGINERTFSPIIIRDGNGHSYTITSDRTDEMFGAPRGFNSNDDIYIAMLPVSGKTVSFYTKCSNHYLFTASNTTLTAGKFYRNLSIEMVKDESGQCNRYRDLRDGSITANDGDIIYQRVNTSAVDKTITIPDGYTVTLAGVNISATGSAGIICSGDATFNLEGANSVTTSANEYPAMQVGPTGKTLTIQGSGSVTATGGQYAAGIGTGSFSSGLYTCGNIIIESGTITANGGQRGAGIGGGNNGICGNITISGGTVTANGGSYGAGIGSGNGFHGTGVYDGICGVITISGGTVTANGGLSAAGIGSGDYGKFASINITDGISSIRASAGSSYAEPIGKGVDDNGSGSVTVDGVTDWSGTATEHLNFSVSSITYYNDTWTLTHK